MTGDEPVIGVVVVPPHGAAHTACLDCVDPDAPNVDDVLRDAPVYGEQVPYPECAQCGDVIRPGEPEEVE